MLGRAVESIIEKYMACCRAWNEHVLIVRTSEQRQEVVATTIDLRIQKGCLAEYLQAHKAEIEKNMFPMLSPEYVRMASERTERIKSDIEAFRSIDYPEDKIKENIIRRYDLTPTYAQNFLDDDNDPEDCRPWAV